MLALLLACRPEPTLLDADGDGAWVPLDCDDADPAVLPGAGEVCGDDVDNDCDGTAAGCGPAGWVPLADADARVLGAPSSSYSGVEAIATGDADGDGRGDVAVAGSAEDGVSIRVVHGPIAEDVSLADRQPTVAIVGERYEIPGMAFGDADGDGLDELLVVEVPEEIDEVWTSDATIYAGSEPIAWGSILDSRYRPTCVFLGEGAFLVGAAEGAWVLPIADAGLFLASTAGDGAGGALAADDLDGDGLRDALVGASDSAVYIVLAPFGDGDSLDGADAVLRGEWGHGVATGDTDGDGRPDVVTTDRGSASVFRDPLAEATVADARIDGDDLGGLVDVPGDVDGDGRADIVLEAMTGCWEQGCARLYAGDAAGSLSPDDAVAVLVGESSWSYAANQIDGADLDGDGLADLLVAAWTGDGVLYVVGGGPGF